MILTVVNVNAMYDSLILLLLFLSCLVMSLIAFQKFLAPDVLNDCKNFFLFNRIRAVTLFLAALYILLVDNRAPTLFGPSEYSIPLSNCLNHLFGQPW